MALRGHGRMDGRWMGVGMVVRLWVESNLYTVRSECARLRLSLIHVPPLYPPPHKGIAARHMCGNPASPVDLPVQTVSLSLAAVECWGRRWRVRSDHPTAHAQIEALTVPILQTMLRLN